MSRIFLFISASILISPLWGQSAMSLKHLYQNRLAIYAETHLAGQNLKGYYSGTCEIRSGKEVAIGMDTNADGSYDKFFGLQTDNSYSLKRATEGCELIYIEHLVIYRSQNADFVATLSFKDFDGVQEPWYEVPQEIRLKANDHNYFGYGVRAHFGEEYTFEHFIE